MTWIELFDKHSSDIAGLIIGAMFVILFITIAIVDRRR